MPQYNVFFFFFFLVWVERFQRTVGFHNLVFIRSDAIDSPISAH